MTATANKTKRQRYVYPTDRIGHLWAHETQSEARNPQNNFYFRGDTIYSYGGHFPIARHVGKRKGNKVVFMTTRGYSSTTSQHIWNVRRAIPDSYTVFNVPNPYAQPKEILAYFKAGVKSLTEDMAKARNKISRAKRYGVLTNFMAKANRFAETFGYKTRFSLPAESEAENRIADAKAAKAQAEAAAEHERQLAIAKPLFEAELDKWRKGVSNRLSRYVTLPDGRQFYFGYDDIPTMLRIKGDQVETSRGVEFPVAHAKRVLKLVKRLLKSGRTYQRNGHTIHLGHYSLDSIDGDGTIRAGCHTILKEEAMALIEQIESIKTTELA